MAFLSLLSTATAYNLELTADDAGNLTDAFAAINMLSNPTYGLLPVNPGEAEMC
jgi:hypothetical protein